ncbi:GTP-binding protein [Lacinutrix neustonica]|uniref:GTP-binding protein n=1 Tax=Lacinutrix neustonica TaxID=2980107 RepID=A0A9E8MWR1_9FLAO|nr:GTP-binding protein [Lacinutrix neustonica]WAC01695.1 GTP-binding protein [Lacinutrix neustonica]
MNETLNDVVLRPRFKITLNKNNEHVLSAFDSKKQNQEQFIVSGVDDHIFIKLPKKKQKFWSPQLHLEINETASNKSIVYGLFGPNPTVWTLFIFLHFAVAGLFTAFAIWTYSNWALKEAYALQVWGMVLMIIIWFVLYIAGRVSKTSNQKEMNALYHFMTTVIKQ